MAAAFMQYEGIDKSVRRVLADSGVRLIGLNMLMIRTAVLIKNFSGRRDLALHWVRLQQERQCRWRPGLAIDVTPALLDRWCLILADDLIVRRCEEDPSAALGGTAREFLVESLLAEKVRELTSLGLKVPSGFALNKFLSLLNALPENPVTRDRLRSLCSSESACKKWSKRFRNEWSLSWGTPLLSHGVSMTGAERRCIIFLRWLRFWHSHWGPDAHVVVVNMDETALGAIKSSKYGIVDQRARSEVNAVPEIPRERALPRTSLLASVCSDEDVQKLLPQIRLPRSPGGRVPSRQVCDHYSASGPPQMAWHGSGGFVTARVVIWYLTKMVREIRRHRPGANILLVWDACPVHLGLSVLRKARDLRIGVVFVPGRMTWALQPLDTHVFAALKKRSRDLEFELKAAEHRSTLSPGQRIRIHGQAIRDVLVERSWARVLQRAGLAKEILELRPAVKELMGRQHLAPAFPTKEHLMEILAIKEPRAKDLLSLLRPHLGPSPHRASVAPPASASAGEVHGGAADAAESVVHPAVLRPVVLSRSARLPPRVGARSAPSNVWLPCFAGRSVQTRSMSAASAASASAAASSSAPPPAKRARGDPV
jgi:hypothetical protein